MRSPIGVTRALLASLTLLALAAPANAQLALSRWTSDSGGGPLTGGTYSLNGSVGQADAGTFAGGTYSLQGGFWFGGAAFLGVNDPPVESALPRTLSLDVYPNPVRGSATIRWDLPQPGHIKVSLFDAAGRRIATLADEGFRAGTYGYGWRPVDDSGNRLGAGVYFLRLETGEQVHTRRLLVVQ